MLAQNFQTAEALDIPETHRQALMKTLVLLETGKLTHVHRPSGWVRLDHGRFTGHFNMGNWRNEYPCGTVCCIGGTAETVGAVSFKDTCSNDAIDELFGLVSYDNRFTVMERVTPAQAAVALRSYLTTGAANWKAALAT